MVCRSGSIKSTSFTHHTQSGCCISFQLVCLAFIRRFVWLLDQRQLAATDRQGIRQRNWRGTSLPACSLAFGLPWKWRGVGGSVVICICLRGVPAPDPPQSLTLPQCTVLTYSRLSLPADDSKASHTMEAPSLPSLAWMLTEVKAFDG